MFKELVTYTNKLCGPSYIYFIFSAWTFLFLIIRMIITRQFSLTNAILNLATSYVVIFTLNWLCEKGWTNFSWFLLYWMFAFVLIILIGTFMLMNKMLDKSKT